MTSFSRVPPTPRYDHLLRFTDDVGMLEHAQGAIPKREHGYCTDDNARALIVVCRAKDQRRLGGLADRYLAFLRHAYRGEGQFLNRLEYDRTWDVRRGENLWDGCGRALWSLGIASVHAKDVHSRRFARDLFLDGAESFRPPYVRSAAFAAVGAAELLRVEDNPTAEAMARFAVSFIDDGRTLPGSWQWMEDQLTYANGLLPHALIATGSALHDDAIAQRGLQMLRWLVDRCTAPEGHLSVCPSGGWTRANMTQDFDQQPIEVSTLADAAVAAFEATYDPAWLDVVQKCAAWFLGDNDGKSYMIDDSSAGGFDGLQRDGVNPNQGAESSLALLSTMQWAERFSPLAALR